MINKNAKNKNNKFVYMIHKNIATNISLKNGINKNTDNNNISIKTGDKQVNMQQQQHYKDNVNKMQKQQ